MEFKHVEIGGEKVDPQAETWVVGKGERYG
jgi:hypothetical protein